MSLTSLFEASPQGTKCPSGFHSLVQPAPFPFPVSSLFETVLLVFYLVVDDRGTVDSCALSFQMCLWQIRKVELSDDRASVKQMNPETCVQPSKSVGGNDKVWVIQWDDAVYTG